MEDLVESILDYIRADYTDYAIMINGEWGSGKTYLDNRKWVTGRKSGGGKAAGHQHYRRISGKSAFAFSAHRQSAGFLVVLLIPKFQVARPPF